MPQGPQRQRIKTPRGPNAVHGEWHGGPNYATGQREQFRSQAHARSVFQNRVQGYDPVSQKRTPLVSDSEMKLYRGADDPEPFKTLKQTNRGIRTER